MKGRHLDIVRQQPCVVGAGCAGSVEAHHPMGGGMGLKTADERAMPLCQKHHQERHALTGYFKGWKKDLLRDWECSNSSHGQEEASK